MKRYVIKLTGTDLWLQRGTVYGHGMSDHYTFTWVLSPLNATRWDTIDGATKATEKGVPIGHFEVFRLLDSVEPVGTRDAPEVREVVCHPVCKDKRNAWCRFWGCAE